MWYELTHLTENRRELSGHHRRYLQDCRAHAVDRVQVRSSPGLVHRLSTHASVLLLLEEAPTAAFAVVIYLQGFRIEIPIKNGG